MFLIVKISFEINTMLANNIREIHNKNYIFGLDILVLVCSILKENGVTCDPFYVNSDKKIFMHPRVNNN